jgi:hypothetical protein
MVLLNHLIRHYIKDSLKSVASTRMTGMTKLLQSYGHIYLLIRDRLDKLTLKLSMDKKL